MRSVSYLDEDTNLGCRTAFKNFVYLILGKL